MRARTTTRRHTHNGEENKSGTEGRKGEKTMKCGREAVGEEMKRDRQMDGERVRGLIIGFHTLRDEEGPLHSFSVQTHLTAVCSLQQQCAHTRTHVTAGLTAGTINLLRGIDTAYEIESEDNGIASKDRPLQHPRNSVAAHKHNSLPAISCQVGNSRPDLVLSPSIYNPSVQSGPHTHIHNSLVKGSPVALSLRGSTLLIRDLPALYLIALTHTHTDTHVHTH